MFWVAVNMGTPNWRKTPGAKVGFGQLWQASHPEDQTKADPVVRSPYHLQLGNEFYSAQLVAGIGGLGVEGKLQLLLSWWFGAESEKGVEPAVLVGKLQLPSYCWLGLMVGGVSHYP